MPISIVTPQMGESIVEGTIGKWVKKVGDKVERDEVIVEILAANAVSHPGGHLERKKRQPVIQDARRQQGNAEPPLGSLVCPAGQPWHSRCFDPA